jgi:hypothetical protein
LNCQRTKSQGQQPFSAVRGPREQATPAARAILSYAWFAATVALRHLLRFFGVFSGIFSKFFNCCGCKGLSRFCRNAVFLKNLEDYQSLIILSLTSFTWCLSRLPFGPDARATALRMRQTCPSGRLRKVTTAIAVKASPPYKSTVAPTQRGYNVNERLRNQGAMN